MSPVGERLHRFASRFCSRQTMERLVEPMIADIRYEQDAALARGGRWPSWRVRAAGYLAFWGALLVHVVSNAWREVVAAAVADDWLIGRIVAIAALVCIAITAALVLPPLLHYVDMLGVGAAAFVAPQAIMLAIPFALSVGVAYACRGRRPSARTITAVVIVALCGAIAAVSTREWMIPDANSSFRTAVAGFHGAEVGGLHGRAELSLSALRVEIEHRRRQGSVIEAAALARVYHLHGALCMASLALAIIALGASTLSSRRVVAAGVGVAAPLAYWLCLAAVDAAVKTRALDSTSLWLPNVLFLACGAFLVVRCSRRTCVLDARA